MSSGAEIHRDNIAADQRRAALAWGNRLGNRIVNHARREAPVDEGGLRASIAHVVIPQAGGVRVVVGSELPYAEYVHEGTGIYGPHGTPIVPVTKKALKFRASMKHLPKRPAKGKRPFVIVRSVKGSPPNPYLARALVKVLGPIVNNRRG